MRPVRKCDEVGSEEARVCYGQCHARSGEQCLHRNAFGNGKCRRASELGMPIGDLPCGAEDLRAMAFRLVRSVHECFPFSSSDGRPHAEPNGTPALQACFL